MREIDTSMNEYMTSQGKNSHIKNNLDIMKAKAKKILKDTKFSEVDSDLNQLHDFIMQNNSSIIFENKLDTRATPFNKFHNDLKTKGKKICVDTLSIMMKR